MTPYDLEAWAFSLLPEARREAFQVVADSFEEHGDLKSAEIRRSWAESMRRGTPQPKDLIPAWLGYCFSLETGDFHHCIEGVYTVTGQVFPPWVEHPRLRNDFNRPKNAWYNRRGHWNKRKALMKMSIAELAKRAESRS